ELLRGAEDAPGRRAFDAGLRPGPSPDRAASLLPGLLAATRTGTPTRWRRRACVGSGQPNNHPQLWAHEEEHVQPPGDGLDGEEIADEHAGGLQAEELAPAWARAPWRGPKTGGGEDTPDRPR